MPEISQFRFEVVPYHFRMGDGPTQVEWRITVEANGQTYRFSNPMPRIPWHKPEADVYIRAAIAELARMAGDVEATT